MTGDNPVGAVEQAPVHSKICFPLSFVRAIYAYDIRAYLHHIPLKSHMGYRTGTHHCTTHHVVSNFDISILNFSQIVNLTQFNISSIAYC